MKIVTQTTFTILFLLLFTLNIIQPVSAQSDSKVNVARNLLQAKSADTKLGADELSTMKVSSETYSKKSGVTNIYFQQYINEIPVHGAILNAHVTSDNKLLTYGNRFVPLANAGIKGNAQPVLSPEQALQAALKALDIKEKGPLVQKSEDYSPVRITVFDRGLIAIEDIKVQLIYQPVGDLNKSVRLAWQVEIYTADAQNWWLARIDAETGELLDKNNYVVQCNFGITNPADCQHIHTAEAPHLTYFDLSKDFSSPSVAMSAPMAPAALNQYKVYPQPYESPIHITPSSPADGRVLMTNPASPTASPFGWHDTNGVDGAEYTTTRGNNVYAYADTDANNTPDAGSSPDGGVNLVFDFPIDLTQAPGTYKPAAVTNLFYWNNYIHDFAYAYGFDEANGNFQVNNYGNGGAGNDAVNAEAQDGSGTNNANFATPNDGSQPRMQMYIGTNPNPDVDGDLDNGVIAHEYAHGISNRLTGGPSNSGCLGNQEQMGEGWSDFYALMTTLEPGDAGTDSRGIGNYLFGNPLNGPGIRPTPYSTDMAINPSTYNTIKTVVAPHGVGYVWCGMIWDLAWAMIEDHGQNAGFDVAMNLVNEGMKLQPCSPGFVDGRDAILAADLVLYNGENRCRIWDVFARRGLGFSALQGSTNNKNDGTEAFDIPNFCILEATPVMGSVCAPADAEYTVNNGTSDELTLSASGNPSGTTVSFSANPVSANSTSTMTIGNTGAAAAGTYTVTVTGTGSVNLVSDEVTLIIQTGVPITPTLVSPANLAVNQVNPTLTWDALTSAESYEVQVATDDAFTNVIASANGLVNPTYQTAGLDNLTTYYWRARGLNACGNGEFASSFSFNTANIICDTYVSPNVPVAIPTTVATVTSTLNIAGCGGTISDLNVLGLNITHTWIDDVVIDLTSPGGTTVRLINRPCGSEDNILINFDDEAASPNYPCPPVDNGTYKPSAPLSAFDGENLAGIWTLTVADVVNQDGGSLNGWSLEICYGPEEEITCYRDQDIDTYGDAGNPQTFCSVCGDGYVSIAGDCNDNNPSVNPGATEICGNGTDDNCDGVVDENCCSAPIALCKPYTAVLNSGGSVTITAADVDNGSTSECGLQSITVSPSTFSCSNVGPNNVTLTVTDINGISVSCQTVVNVVDMDPPTIVCPASNVVGLTLDLGFNCSAPLPDYTFLATADDNCSVLSVTQSPTAGTIVTGTGSMQVFLTVFDVNGNSNSCNFTLVVQDATPPTAICQSATVQLNSAGTASVSSADVNNGSYDNCGIASMSVSPSSFTCADVGANTVTLTVTDVNNNVSTCTATVTVQDNIPPTAICQNVTVQLNATGNASVTAAQVNNGSNDACGIAFLSLSKTAFTCVNVGVNAIVLAVTDNNGNVSTCTASVIVEDNIPPTAICRSATVQLNSAGTASVSSADVNNGSYDNCGIASMSVSPSSFTCADVGANTVTLTVTDANNNVSTCTASVIVEDNIPPTAICQNVTVQLNAAGYASVTTAQVNNGSFDNCGIASMSVSPNSFTCANVGANSVTLTVTDVNNNVSTCTATVTVQDNILPTALCQNATVQLGADGTASVSSAEVNNGSYDNCGIASMSVSPNSFTCANVGANSVTLTVTDVNNNVSTCSATVTVQDNILPTSLCQNATVQLNSAGTASVSSADVNNGSYDNCGIASMSVSPNSFTCANVGANSVTLTVTDVNNNVSTCTATVTVQDNILPTALCQNAIVQLNSAGMASVSSADVNNGSYDNCGIASMSVSPNSFTCANVGANTVTLTVTDVSNNVSTCTATVIVLIRPTTLTINAPLTGQYSDNVTLSATLTDELSNTGIAGKSISFVLGTQGPVTGTTDASGTATVQIALNQAPGDKAYTVSYTGECLFAGNSASETFVVAKENACYEYTGQFFASCATSNYQTNVFMSATIFEESGGNTGDIRNGQARFVVKDGSNVIHTSAWMPINLVAPDNLAIGYITYNWIATVLSKTNTSQIYDVSVELSAASYYELCSDQQVVLNLYVPTGEFITGGGYIIAEESAGTYAADTGTKTNFGFNVKWNKKGTNLQGKMNVIIRRMESDGIVHLYQIKTNATKTLGVNVTGACDLAEFSSKASMTDITDPLNPIGLGGNMDLFVTMTDCGEPGTSDMIGLTLYSQNTLYFSSNWPVNSTEEQLLAGGNIVVHSTSNLTKEVIVLAQSPEISARFVMDVYPNPSSGPVSFKFTLPETAKVTLEIFNANGMLIERLLEEVVDEGIEKIAVLYKELSEGMYMYKLTYGTAVETGKFIKTRK